VTEGPNPPTPPPNGSGGVPLGQRQADVDQRPALPPPIRWGRVAQGVTAAYWPAVHWGFPAEGLAQGELRPRGRLLP